jgi:DNA-binding transcriptional MerR regulator
MVQDLSHKQFTAKDIYEIFGIDKNKLFHWINTHRLLKPDIEEGSGRGRRRVFSRNNLLELNIIKKMQEYGIELSAIKKFKTFLDRYKVKAKYKDGRWFEIEGKATEDTRTFSLYDWAFKGEETGLKIYKMGKKVYLYTTKWKDRPETEEDKKETLWPDAYLVINVTTIANAIKVIVEKM